MREEYASNTSIVLAERPVWAGHDTEPSRFVQDWRGRIVLEDSDTGDKEVIGAFAFRVIDLGSSLNEEVSYFNVFDSYQSTFDVFETLYDLDTDELKEGVAQLAFGEDFQPTQGVLLLERLEVLPAHRGQLVGLRAMKTIIEQFCLGVGLVVLKAFPLQFEGDEGPADREGSLPRSELRLNDFTRSERVAKSKLKKYYGRLGFKPVPRTEYMVLDAARRLPSVDLEEAPDPVVPAKRPAAKLSLVRPLQQK